MTTPRGEYVLRNFHFYFIWKAGQRLAYSTGTLLETRQTTLKDFHSFVVLHPTQMIFMEEGISPYLEDHTKLHLFMPSHEKIQEV